MSRHDGVSCDGCDQQAFSGRRYKCLRCFDFDLCGPCYDSRNFCRDEQLDPIEARIVHQAMQHSVEHPMQCILTRTDMLLYFGGEPGSAADAGAIAFTCPYCGQLGFSQADLADHVAGEHADAADSTGHGQQLQVICPVCAACPSGAPNHQTRNLAYHLQFDHGPGARGADDPSLFAGSSGLRTQRDPPRRGLPSLNRVACVTVRPSAGASRGRGLASASAALAAATGGGVGRSSGSGGGGGVIERLAWPLAGDPIAELLSQLSSVRGRPSAAAAAVSSQLAQLEMQLQSTRAQLERLPGHSSVAGGRSGTGAGPSSAAAGRVALAVNAGGLAAQQQLQASRNGNPSAGLRLKAAGAANGEQQQAAAAGDASAQAASSAAIAPPSVNEQQPLSKDKYPLLGNLLAAEADKESESKRKQQELADQRSAGVAALLLLNLFAESYCQT